MYFPPSFFDIIVKINNAIHSLTCITRLFSKRGKNCNALKKDLHSKNKVLQLVATPQVKYDKTLTLAHQRSLQQNLRKFEGQARKAQKKER